MILTSATIRASLLARKPSELRLAGRHTRNALKTATNPYERAALETGLSTLGEAYALSMTEARRNAVTRKIALDDTIRGLSDHAKAVRMLAAQLVLDLPQICERVSSAAKQRGSAEDMVAIDGALTLQKLREKSKAANQTATNLQTAVRGLDQAYRQALATGSANGGYAREHKLALTTISYKTSTAVAWIPPLPDDHRTVRRRVEDALHAGRLPIPMVKKKPNLKARVKRDQEWHESQNQKREQERRKAAALKPNAAPTNVSSDAETKHPARHARQAR